MLVRELIEQLQKVPQNAPVWSFDWQGNASTTNIIVDKELDGDGEIGVRSDY